MIGIIFDIVMKVYDNKDKKEIRDKHLSKEKTLNRNLLSIEAIGNLYMSEKYKMSENVL